MKVKELIIKLLQYPYDAEVYFSNGDVIDLVEYVYKDNEGDIIVCDINWGEWSKDDCK